MTNLEWLRTLSAEELVEFLSGNYQNCRMCIHCDDYCIEAGGGCNDGKVAWLNAEHKEELKPCPFCGAEGTFMNFDSNVFWVQCGSCGSHGRQSKTKDEAIKMWNRRADDGN